MGLILISVAFQDLFRTLFHTVGHGALSDWVARFVWKVCRKLAKRNRKYISLAGPLAILFIMMMWIFTTVLGFTLIYYPFMKTQVTVATGLDPKYHQGFSDAFNLSLGSLITVGGDFLPKSKLIRLATGLEATIGFGLLTASVSWLLSIYPALERRRTLAHEATLLHYAERSTGIRIHHLQSAEAQQVIWGLAVEMATTRNDLTQFPIIYYCDSGDETSGFSAVLPYMTELALASSDPSMPPSVRLAAISLGGAIDDYLEYIAEMFMRIPTDDKCAIMRHYADEHLQEWISLDRIPLPKTG